MTAEIIYLDHNATTPVDARVLSAMSPFFETHFGNAASRSHAFGRRALDASERARSQVASLIGAATNTITFTSGATEADNLALKGVALASSGRKHFVSQVTEHRAVLDTCESLQKHGHQITLLDVDAHGRVDPDAVASAITDQTALVSIMLCNNEIGTVQPIADIAEVTSARGVLLHCDAAQGLGYLDLDVSKTPIDLLSMSAHKMYGPKGVGALYVRPSVRQRNLIVPLIDGGGHERGLRSGTLNVAGAVGFGAAADIIAEHGVQEAARLRTLSGQLLQHLKSLGQARLNGHPDQRHPGNINVSFGGVDGARLLIALSERLAVSSGAACSSATPGPSYVLEAIGAPDADASIRFGAGRSTTEADIATAADHVAKVLGELR